MENNNDSARVITHSNKRNEKFNEVYAEAMELIRRFEVRELVPMHKLREVADKFVELIDIDERRIEPYIYLAKIFFLVDNKDLAFKYLKLAREIDPENQEINQVKDMILRHYLQI
jgi:hypothetical protein